MWAFPVGACSGIEGRESCEAVAGPTQPGVSMCEFIIESADEGTCSYIAPDSGGSLLSPGVVQVVLVATFIAVPFLKLFQWVVENVLLAPTLKKVSIFVDDEQPEDGLARRQDSVPPPPKLSGEAFELEAVLLKIRHTDCTEAWRGKFTEIATEFEGHLDDFDAHLTRAKKTGLSAEDQILVSNLTPEWRRKARRATWDLIVAALARKDEIDDAIFDLDDSSWLPNDCTTTMQKRRLRLDLCRVRAALVRDWQLQRVGMADGDFTKVAYGRMLALHAQAQAWGGALSRCSPRTVEAEEQLLIFTRLENLGKSETQIYGQLYSTSVEADAAGKKPVSPCRKVFWTAVLAFAALFMIWWTLAVLLALREAEGAAIVRTWWRMAMFSQILALVIFEPLSIFIFSVLLPLTLSGKLRIQGADPAAKAAFPWAAQLVDRASQILAEEYADKAPVIAQRIRGAAPAVLVRQVLVSPQSHPTSARMLGVGAERRRANRAFRDSSERWRAGFISKFVAQHIAWRRPAGVQVLFSVLALVVLLEENLQGLLVDEGLAGVYMCMSWLGFIRLPKSLAGTILYHAILPAVILALSLGPLGLRSLAYRARRKTPTDTPAASGRIKSHQRSEEETPVELFPGRNSQGSWRGSSRRGSWRSPSR